MFNFYCIGIIISIILNKLNIESARGTIERKGFKIDDYKLDFYDRINANLRDYAFVFIPIYHLYKSIYVDRYLTSHDAYVQNRLKIYDDLGILRNANDEELIEKEAKEEIRKKEYDEAEKQYEQAQEEMKSIIKEKITGEKRVDPYTDLDNKRRLLTKYETMISLLINDYKQAEEQMTLPYEERQAKYDRIMDYNNKIINLREEIKRDEHFEELDAHELELTNKKEEQVLQRK